MIVTSFPRAVREIEHTTIPLKDGTRLAARIWLPEDAEADPVPALLEYLPYRKRDGTHERDALTHPYLAGHGYAAVRVDIRGSGESEGVLADEYSQPELDDALEVIDWLASQPWCSGAVGMFGISWGGFNALQVAALQPPALKAIVTLCSTDDRYADDVHYMGGAKLASADLGWGGFFFADMCHPPDPLLVGERWREMWLERLQNMPLFLERWLRHQRRDAYWRHGSVCEDVQRHPLPGLRRRRLDRWLHQQRPAPARASRRAAQGPDRSVGACLSAFRQARSADRLPAGDAALVGPLAEGQADGRHGRADAARLDDREPSAGVASRDVAGTLGGRARLAAS